MNGRQGNIQPDQADHKHSSAHKIIACIAALTWEAARYIIGSAGFVSTRSSSPWRISRCSFPNDPIKGRCNRVGQNIKGIKKKDFFPVPAPDLSEPFQKDQHHNHSRRPAHNLCKHPHGILSPVGHLCQKTIFKKRSVYSIFSSSSISSTVPIRFQSHFSSTVTAKIQISSKMSSLMHSAWVYRPSQIQTGS